MLLIDSRKKITNVGGSAVYSPLFLQKNLNLFNPEHLKSIQTDHDFSVLRQMDAPFQLLQETYREDADGISYTLTQLSPDQTIYISSGVQSYDSPLNSHRELHRHDFLELLFVLEGEIYQNIENERHFYPKGSCCLLNQNVFHTEEKSDHQRLLYLQIQKEYLEMLLHSSFYFESEKNGSWEKMSDLLQSVDGSIPFQKAYMDFIPGVENTGRDDYIREKFEMLFHLLLEPSPGATFHAAGLILEILCRLFDERYYHPAPIRFASSKEEDLFRKLTEYLVSSHGRTSRSELVKEFNYSGDYLYKLTRKFTGLSLSDYAMSICLKEAAELLSSTDTPVSLIIDQLGFSNKTHFYKHFRKYFGISPAAYRRMNPGDRLCGS